MVQQRKKLNRLNDALMKYIFANPERKQLTLSLINAFFEVEGTKQLVDFEFRDRELDAKRKKVSAHTLISLELVLIKHL